MYLFTHFPAFPDFFLDGKHRSHPTKSVLSIYYQAFTQIQPPFNRPSMAV
jgi:hypothetical protein